MIKYKTIHNLFESWGKNKQEIPLKNDILKKEILSKVLMKFDRNISTKHSPLIWLPFSFAALAVFILLFNTTGFLNNTKKLGTQTGEQMIPSAVLDTDRSNKSIVPFYREEGLPISDNREFLKVNYNATLRTRHITDLKTRAETIIRGLNGRVDSSNGGDRNGYINFVIPKDNLEAFKIGIKDLVGEKFYSEQINSQNLLGEKQMIERNQEQAEKNLSNLQIERGQIVKNHNQNSSAYQIRINSINAEINTLNIEYSQATAMRKAEIVNRISQLQTEMNVIQSEVASENKNFQTKINRVDGQIKNTQRNLETIKLQDNNLLDNVATVNGSISLNWISLWEMADVYLPGPILTWIFFLAAFLTFFWYRYSTRISYLDF